MLVLIDSGATMTVLQREAFLTICKDQGRKPILKKAPGLVGVTGHELKVCGRTEICVRELGVLPVTIIENLPHAMILGRDLMRAKEAVIDYKRGVLSWGGDELPLVPRRDGSLQTKHTLAMVAGDHIALKIANCMQDNPDVFSGPGQRIGRHPNLEIHLETTGPPIKQRAYRIPFMKREALSQKIDEYLKQGIIEPSNSPWASPVVLVQKKDQSEGPRFCIDFTKLNMVLKKDCYPVPLIQDVFDQLHGSTIYSTLDLKSGFHQLPLDNESMEKTAFTCFRGQFQFRTLPMGLSLATSVFQRAMDEVLKGLIGKTCMIYVDDIVIYSKDIESHYRDLQEVIERFRMYKLTLNPKKCVFGQREVKLLGFVVSGEGLKADPDKVAAITRMSAPKTVKEVRSFLGMTGYYRTCMPGYAGISEPLVALTRKYARFEWTNECQESFIRLKDLLVSEQVMAHPRTRDPYLLYTDASDLAIGAILCQRDPETGVERPISYMSKLLSPTQRRWAAIEREAYALISALKHFRPYLFGAKFDCFTDHKPLVSLFTKEMQNTKIQRWAVLMAEFGCKVQYRKGKLNVRADMLSRIQPESIDTFDVDEWQMNDELPGNLPEDLQPPILHDDLPLDQVQEAQVKMDEWGESLDPESPYEVINGLLYSIKKPYQYAAEYHRLVLPEEFREQIIHRSHEEVGHMAHVKTLRQVQQAYVWSGMRREIRQWVSKCPICITHSARKQHVAMGEMPFATHVGQIISLDLVGPLITSPQGNSYILNIIDHASGFSDCYAIPRKTSECVWRVLHQEYFPRNGFPEVAITDLGMEFNAMALRNYLASVGIKHHKTTAYHPSSNGRVERFNKTLKGIIAKLVNNNTTLWQDKLGPAMLSYNCAVSDVTMHSPFFLYYGRRPKMPLHRAMVEDNLVEGRLHDLYDAIREAQKMTEDSRKYNRERLRKKENVGDLKVGDTVVIKAEEPLTLTSKWDPQWLVTKVKGKVIWVTHQHTGKQKVINREKAKLVDPNIIWDSVRARPKRNPRQTIRPWQQPAPPLPHSEHPRGREGRANNGETAKGSAENANGGQAASDKESASPEGTKQDNKEALDPVRGEEPSNHDSPMDDHQGASPDMDDHQGASPVSSSSEEEWQPTYRGRSQQPVTGDPNKDVRVDSGQFPTGGRPRLPRRAKANLHPDLYTGTRTASWVSDRRRRRIHPKRSYSSEEESEKKNPHLDYTLIKRDRTSSEEEEQCKNPHLDYSLIKRERSSSEEEQESSKRTHLDDSKDV